MIKNDDVLLLSVIDPTRAYSCIKYLCQYLNKRGIKIECWSNVSKNNLEEYHGWAIDTHSYTDNILGRVPKLRTLYKRFIGFIYAYAYRNKTIICHDLFHYESCAAVKKKYPKTNLILYFTEIYNDKHSNLVQNLQKNFLINPNEMDYMIECDYYRERYRKEKNGVNKPSGTILNTIPKSEIQEFIDVSRKENDVTTIVYSGGLYGIGDLDIIVNALKDIKEKYCMEFYCFGNSEAIEQLRKECEEKIKGKYRIIQNLPRKQVYKSIRNADIGIVYYDPEYSVNTLYAAPTKFYEYVGLEIPIVCSANESLAYIVNKYGLGEIMHQNNSEGMKDAIEKLLVNEEYRNKVSQNESIAFETALCYEKQSREVLENIVRRIEGK